MSGRIHDDEPDTSEATVRALLAAECPVWAELPMEYLRSSGTDNAMWRLRPENGNDLVVRLPRRPHAAETVEPEMGLLGALAATHLSSVVHTPRVRHVGEPHEVFPHRWSIMNWLEGTDAWSARHTVSDNLDALAVDLAEAVLMIGDLVGLPAPERVPGRRGGPIEPLVRTIEWWLNDPQWNAAHLVDVAAVRRLAAEALEVSTEPVVAGFTHGDLIPGNLLVTDGRLTSIIDWGGAGYGDRAQDLAPAWAVLEAGSRAVFRDAVRADEAAWIRARTFELEHAVGGVLYYVPRRHPLGDVMARTLEHILHD
jgi:aminoglycoside phosphotransferase (APT) family kinase protein